jgi:hypothetical protein
VVFRFTVADRLGTFSAFNAFADVTLPAGYTVTRTTSDRGPGCSAGPPGLVCNLDFVQPGSDGHVIIFGTVGQAGPLTISVHVRHFGEEGNTADDTATLTVQPVAPPAGGGGGSTGGGSGGSSGGTTVAKAVSAPAVPSSGVVGATIRAKAPRWSATPSRLTYQWQLCTVSRCTAIEGATKLTLKLAPAYAGRSVRVVATAKIAGKTATTTSRKIAVRKKS